MKTEVTRTVVTLVEVHTRETGDATVKGVSKVSDDSTLSRKVWINGEEVYAEQYPTRWHRQICATGTPSICRNVE